MCVFTEWAGTQSLSGSIYMYIYCLTVRLQAVQSRSESTLPHSPIEGVQSHSESTLPHSLSAGSAVLCLLCSPGAQCPPDSPCHVQWDRSLHTHLTASRGSEWKCYNSYTDSQGTDRPRWRTDRQTEKERWENKQRERDGRTNRQRTTCRWMDTQTKKTHIHIRILDKL